MGTARGSPRRLLHSGEAVRDPVLRRMGCPLRGTARRRHRDRASGAGRADPRRDRLLHLAVPRPHQRLRDGRPTRRSRAHHLGGARGRRGPRCVGLGASQHARGRRDGSARQQRRRPRPTARRSGRALRRTVAQPVGAGHGGVRARMGPVQRRQGEGDRVADQHHRALRIRRDRCGARTRGVSTSRLAAPGRPDVRVPSATCSGASNARWRWATRLTIGAATVASVAVLARV